ncbi:radical SAM superfamily protein [Indivirus ILV1]|uniref:tRNA carboxymethyluridine synthase n=1 Tax=Indivirus ILV1 TaxID=1977633 RepID=A0A1V0SCZ5_9VIRU|nr:radical SAM superfamily protein [Indivirus ILV1]
MSCVNENTDEIEDIIPIPKDFIENPIVIEPVIHKMLKTEINSTNEFLKFIRAQQKIIHITLSPIKILYVYRMMIKDGKINKNEHYEKFMKAKNMRSTSGVMVVTLVTSPWPKTAEEDYGLEIEGDIHKGDIIIKPERTIELAKKYKNFSCKFDCFFCPSEPGQARSYLKREPAVARANQNRFDAISQFRDRGLTYLINGHYFDKVELLVLGGTWSSYPKDYQEEFILDTYYAANTFYDKNFKINRREKLSIEEEIRINEKTLCRIIGLTLETRPDQINPDELIRFRRFGVTRVQIGVQHTNDIVLKYVNRGCYYKDIIRAIKLLKDNCFKVDIHLMPDLPGSTPKMDKEMFEFILNCFDLQIDQIKIYPCSVVPWTQIAIWDENEKRNYDTVNNPDGLNKFNNRRYKSYTENTYDNIRISIGKNKDIPSNPLFELLIAFKSNIRPWIRINRLVRDIPGIYVNDSNYREDLRDILHTEMKKRGQKCICIRCREVKNQKSDIDKAILIAYEYNSSGSKEFHLSYESLDRNIVFGFLRLRIPNNDNTEIVFNELKDTALIRELHVYGTVVPVNKQNDNQPSAQHMGLGKKLLRKAEFIAYQHKFKRIAVISGVGVRNYYRKQEYYDADGFGNFQIKTLTDEYITKISPIECIFVSPPQPVKLKVRKNIDDSLALNKPMNFNIKRIIAVIIFTYLVYKFFV